MYELYVYDIFLISLSTSRPYDWPAAEGDCGNCCSISVLVYSGGGCLLSLSLPSGKRTEDPRYPGKATTHTLAIELPCSILVLTIINFDV